MPVCCFKHIMTILSAFLTEQKFHMEMLFALKSLRDLKLISPDF